MFDLRADQRENRVSFRLILPENRDDAKRFLFLNETRQVVAKNFAEHFVLSIPASLRLTHGPCSPSIERLRFQIDPIEIPKFGQAPRASIKPSKSTVPKRKRPACKENAKQEKPVRVGACLEDRCLPRTGSDLLRKAGIRSPDVLAGASLRGTYTRAPWRRSDRRVSI